MAVPTMLSASADTNGSMTAILSATGLTLVNLNGIAIIPEQNTLSRVTAMTLNGSTVTFTTDYPIWKNQAVNLRLLEGAFQNSGSQQNVAATVTLANASLLRSSTPTGFSAHTISGAVIISWIPFTDPNIQVNVYQDGLMQVQTQGDATGQPVQLTGLHNGSDYSFAISSQAYTGEAPDVDVESILTASIRVVADDGIPLCVITDTTFGADGSIKDGVTQTVVVKGGTVESYNGLSYPVTSHGIEPDNWTITLPQGAIFEISRGDGGATSGGTVPTTSTATLASILEYPLVGEDAQAP